MGVSMTNVTKLLPYIWHILWQYHKIMKGCGLIITHYKGYDIKFPSIDFVLCEAFWSWQLWAPIMVLAMHM